MILAPSRLNCSDGDVEVISDLDIREKLTPEGAGFDLRIDKIEEIIGAGSLLVETRHTSETCPVARKDSMPSDILELKGGGLFLASTIEKFNLRDNMAAVFYPRSTLFRSGVVFQSGVAPYGYEGPMTFMLYVANPKGFEIQLGARFAHVLVHRVAGRSAAYRGQWQGGRVTTTKRETQI